MTEKFYNLSSSTLDGAITDVATALDVADATTFPPAGNFRIRIDDEICIVTDVTGVTFTISRGAEGTTGAAHSNGAAVKGVLTAGALDAFKTDLAAATQTLTNKTISGASNTITNVSLTSGVTGTLPTANGGWSASASETLTNKTISGASNTITNVSLTSGVTGTLPTANGGWSASASETLTNKTISGASNTFSNIDYSSITGFGSGVSGFLGAPTSANLATAISDETGSGQLVFGTAPLFKTTINLNNPGNTFKYVITPAAIAADRTLTLPLLAGNDTLVTEAFAQTLTNKTISGAYNTFTNINLSTAVTGTLAGSLVAPAFGAQNITATGYLGLGSTLPASGDIRLPNVTSIKTQDAANANALVALATDASDQAALCGPVTYASANTYDFVYLQTRRGWYWNVGGNPILSSPYGASINAAKPIIGGDNQAFSAHGGVAFAFASNANYTVTAAEFAYDWIEFTTGSWSTGRTVTFPAPASKDLGYYKTIYNNTAYTMTVSTGTGTTRSIPSGYVQRFWFDNSGVSRASRAFVSGAESEIWFRPSSLGAKLAAASTAGSFAVGLRFYVTKAVNCLGVRFYWAVASSKSVKVSLWDSAGTRVANATGTVSATGVVEVLFSAAQALTVGELYRVSAWQTDGTAYVKTTSATAITLWPTGALATAFYAGGPLVIMTSNQFGTGDTCPTTAASEGYYLEPILDI